CARHDPYWYFDVW
nr:immunoglobulin heavy chain junction region [Mus musculus]